MITAVVGALSLTGCDTAEVRQLNDPNAYLQRANTFLAAYDAEAALVRTLEARHGDVSAPLRAALLANARLTPLKSRDPNAGRVAAAKRQTGAIVYVALIVDASGTITDLACEPAIPNTVGPTQLDFVQAQVRRWEFVPATIDGKPVAAEDAFRVQTDGSTYVLRLRDGS